MTSETESGGLAALAAMTAETDNENPGPEVLAEQRAQVAQDEQADAGGREWGQLMFLVGGVVTMIEPQLRPVYAEDRCLTWGRAANAVAIKYEWDSPSLPEIVLATATMGFALPTFFALREKARQIKDARNAGVFGRLVIWWRTRKAAGAGAQLPAAPEGGDSLAAAAAEGAK